MAYKKISGMTAGSAIASTDTFEAVQSSNSVYVTAAQVATYVHANPPAGVTGSTAITGMYVLGDGHELDYSSSFTDGQASALTTFTELPTATKGVLVRTQFADTGTSVAMSWKGSAGATITSYLSGQWADAGTNTFQGDYWIPTYNNSIYVMSVTADTTRTFIIMGYMTG